MVMRVVFCPSRRTPPRDTITPGCAHPQPLVTTLCTVVCCTVPKSIARKSKGDPRTTPWDQHPLCLVVDAYDPLPSHLSAALVASLQQLAMTLAATQQSWLEAVRVLTCHVHQRAAAQPTSMLAALAAQLRDMLTRTACNVPSAQQPVLSLLSRAALLDGSMASGPLAHALECMSDIAAIGGASATTQAAQLCEHMLLVAAALHRPWALAPLLACHARLAGRNIPPAVYVAAASLVLEGGDSAASQTLAMLSGANGARVEL